MQVPGYTEIRELGQGGTGRVMLAVRDADGEAVAIKHLSEQLRADEEFVARFRAEAEVIREIDSPHTARLLEYVEGEDDAVIVMELVDGVTLRRLLAHEGATGAEAALVVLKGALLGLAEAHQRGVVHRDFKPENVIITEEGESKLVDFGVAAHSGETAALVGTPSYMAPEQWDDAPASPATDVYAATLVFFECLTGHRAFQGDNVAALAYQHQHAPPPVEDVDEPLRPLVEHGLAKDPVERPASAQAFLTELEDVALAAYGADWERTGRAGLGLLTVPMTALLPTAQAAAESTTSLFRTTLSPPGKLALTGGLVLATAAAVTSAFVIWSDSTGPGPGIALPPGTPSEARTQVPASPTPEPTSAAPTSEPTPGETLSGTPPVTHAGEPSVAPPPVRPTAGRPERPPTTREPTRSSRPTTRPTRPTTRPTMRPTTRPPTTEPPTVRPPTTRPPDPTTPPVTRPPTTSPPDPGTPPPARNPRPLLSVSVKVSVNVPILSGEGDGLLDADVGLGLGSSLLGLVLVPGGSVLAGRQIAARRARRRREAGKP